MFGDLEEKETTYYLIGVHVLDTFLGGEHVLDAEDLVDAAPSLRVDVDEVSDVVLKVDKIGRL